jgi:membrane-associated phospholipid phosphatase
VVAVLCTWTARPVRLLFLASLPLNLCMLVSTIPCGGHYLLDVIAGVLVTALVIAGVELGFRRRPVPPRFA